MSSRNRARSVSAALLGASLLTLAACSGGDAQETASSTQAAAANGDYPLTIQNCDTEVTFDAAPERAVLLRADAVPYLHELGVMDRVTARAGVYPPEYYDDETLAELDEITLITDELDTSGHLQISKEVVIAQQPDLVLGEVDNLSRSTLSAVDIPLISEPAFCPAGMDTPSFDDIYSQMSLYGDVFGQPDQAAQANEALQARMDELTAEVDADSGRTAAVLYPTVGGGTTYAYGTKSMAHPQLEAAGFENVFADVDERVFEVSVEELLGRNPDVLVLLYDAGDPEEVEAAVAELAGAEGLSAIQDGNVMTQLFNFTEPASPLTIDGLEMITDRFGDEP